MQRLLQCAQVGQSTHFVGQRLLLELALLSITFRVTGAQQMQHGPAEQQQQHQLPDVGEIDRGDRKWLHANAQPDHQQCGQDQDQRRAAPAGDQGGDHRKREDRNQQDARVSKLPSLDGQQRTQSGAGQQR